MIFKKCEFTFWLMALATADLLNDRWFGYDLPHDIIHNICSICGYLQQLPSASAPCHHGATMKSGTSQSGLVKTSFWTSLMSSSVQSPTVRATADGGAKLAGDPKLSIFTE